MNITFEEKLSLDQVLDTIHTPTTTIAPADSVIQRVRKSRDYIESIENESEPIYGVNTGIGKLAQTKIDKDKQERLQNNILKSHATAVGSPLPPQIARLVLLLKINEFAQGYSGVSPRLFRRLCTIYNAGLAPVIPGKGSVGASGDLAPLAHLGETVRGKGQMYSPKKPSDSTVSWKKYPATIALKTADIAPEFRYKPKEGLSIVNGTQVSLALLIDALKHSRKLLNLATIALSLSLDANKCSVAPFHSFIASTKNNSHQKRISKNVRKLLEGSEILKSHEDCEKVQDPYSFRCAPQVHGASLEALSHVETIAEREINSVTDNPIVDFEENNIFSAGNFHGQSIAMGADYLSVALSEIASISERRTENLVNPDLSEHPPFLTEESGENSGMMMYQVVAASLVSENKTHAHPASVDSIPTSGNQEDHVSMSTFGARKLREIVDNVQEVLAVEMLCATQALEFHDETTSPKLQQVYSIIREQIPPLQKDRKLKKDLETMKSLMNKNELIKVLPDRL